MKNRTFTLKDLEDVIDEMLLNRNEWLTGGIITEKEYNADFITLESLKSRLFFKSSAPESKEIA